MELNARQLIALAGPLIIGYLTWSAVSGAVAARALNAPATTITAAAAKRPEVAELARDPFTREAGAIAAALGGSGETSEEDSVLHLNGTVIAGRWRMAIINGARVFEGQTFRGMRLRAVASDGVTLVGPTGDDIRLALEIAPAAPLAKAPGVVAAHGAAAAAQPTPIQRGIDALKSGGGPDLLKSLGIPES